MARGAHFFSHELHSGAGIVADEVVLYRPAKVAFQTDQRAVYRGGLLSLNCLKIAAVVCERWSGDGLHVKITPPLIINSSFGLACFVPSHEMADIAQVVTQRSRSEVFLRTHGLFILGQCTRASRREPRIRLPFHAHLIRERTLAEMHSEGYQEP